MLLLLVIIIVIIVVATSKKKTGVNNTNTVSVPKFTMSVTGPRSYSSILNNLEMIVESTAHRSYCEIGVVVQVQKIDSTYCKIGFSMLADTSFRNVAFGEGFRVNGDDHVQFDTNLATGFTTVDDVRRELLLQFNWSGVNVTNEKMTVIDHGDYLNKPYVCYSFTVKG